MKWRNIEAKLLAGVSRSERAKKLTVFAESYKEMAENRKRVTRSSRALLRALWHGLVKEKYQNSCSILSVI